MTLARRIIPCLDVDAGRVVKGIEFEGLRDMGDPAELPLATTAKARTSWWFSISARRSRDGRRSSKQSAASRSS